MAKTYFNRPPLVVTSSLVKARTRAVRLATLESVDLDHTPLWLALATCAGLVLVALSFFDLLYWYEQVLFVLIGAGGLAVASQFAKLSVYSRMNGEGWPIWGPRGTLVAMKDAIERALSERGARFTSSGGSVHVEHDEDEDDGASVD